MPRLRRQVALSAGAFLLACHAPEEQTLSKFFDAVRSGDHATVAGMSVVGFSGPVDTWEVVEGVSESEEAFRLPKLRHRSAKAEDEREAQFLEYSKFREQNDAALKEIRDRLDRDPDYRFHGKWGQIQAQWEGFRQRYETLDRKRQFILREMDQELKLAKMSLMSAEEIDRLKGVVLVKRLLVKVTTEGAADRFYVFVLRKYELTRNDGDYKPPSRWIIAGIEESGAPRRESVSLPSDQLWPPRRSGVKRRSTRGVEV